MKTKRNGHRRIKDLLERLFGQMGRGYLCLFSKILVEYNQAAVQSYSENAQTIQH